jgi:hypothetical protein
MTATNHMLTGAVIAAAVQQPLLVVPLAFVSHFVLDMFPHFGVEESDTAARNNHPLFRIVLTADLVILALVLVLVPILFNDHVSGWILLLGMIAAWIPDVVWIVHFWRDRRGYERKKPIALTRFHQKIQWFERPPGLITEVIWLGGALAVLSLVVE